jgi:Raf kinase inhibitor-like YbhB/YbcL family protein
MDARADTPTGTDATADRPSTDTPANDSGPQPDAARDNSVDSASPDAASDSGIPDTTPPSDGHSPDASSDAAGDVPSDGAAAMVVTSTGFTEGSMIPADFTCAGANVSPPLAWSPGPPGTQSYALVFTDRSGTPLIHTIMFDIPAATMSLPMNVEKVANPTTPAGAKQVTAYDSKTYGYLGPCPSGVLHNYEFAIHALDVATLPGVTTTSGRAAVAPVINMHTLAKGLLNGQSNAKK